VSDEHEGMIPVLTSVRNDFTTEQLQGPPPDFPTDGQKIFTVAVYEDGSIIVDTRGDYVQAVPDMLDMISQTIRSGSMQDASGEEVGP
jgi:hypothetical protein